MCVEGVKMCVKANVRRTCVCVRVHTNIDTKHTSEVESVVLALSVSTSCESL